VHHRSSRPPDQLRQGDRSATRRDLPRGQDIQSPNSADPSAGDSVQRAGNAEVPASDRRSVAAGSRTTPRGRLEFDPRASRTRSAIRASSHQFATRVAPSLGVRVAREFQDRLCKRAVTRSLATRHIFAQPLIGGSRNVDSAKRTMRVRGQPKWPALARVTVGDQQYRSDCWRHRRPTASVERRRADRRRCPREVVGCRRGHQQRRAGHGLD
jgi:hypothetical protein